jgi:ribulose bisphosphate carboxylase small subunit
MPMKSTVLTLLLLCAGAAYAEAPAAPPAASPEASRHMEDLATLLDLTDAQKPQVQAILQAEHAKMKQTFEQAKASGTRPDWQQMHAMHEQMQQETLQKLSTVLSATQLKKFQIIQQHMNAMHRHMGHGGPPAATPPATQN